MIKRFIAFYKPHKLIFTLDMIAAFTISLCDISFPIITRSILNDFIPNKQLNLLVTFSLALLLIYFIKMLLNFFVQYYGHIMGVKMQADMRFKIFQHLQKLPISYYDENETGVIMSRIINDLMDISELAHHGPEDLFISVVTVLGSFFYLCTISIELTCIIFLGIPLIIFFSYKMRNKMNESFSLARVEVGKVNATLENSISGIRVSRAFGNAIYEEAKFMSGNDKFSKAKAISYKVMGYFYSGNGFIIDALNVLVLIVGGIYTYNGVINYADLVTYMLFINLFINPIKKLTNFAEQYQNGMSGFQRYCEIIDEPLEEEIIDGLQLNDIKGNIEISDVSFNYVEGVDILNNITLSIKEKTTLALVGDSGGGKSTICSLIPRFYNIDGGSIKIDGIDIKDIQLNNLRSHIGMVSQDVFLFNSSIRNNVLYGKLNATEEEMIEACKKANIHEFICSLEYGYDTQVGERGVKLSGGQKQRIAIARVFLKNPKIIILDEATSALDNYTERVIQSSLEELTKDKTTIVVAHRLSTIRNADQIAYISDGEVKEIGSHEELISKNGVYKQLYDNQFS